MMSLNQAAKQQLAVNPNHTLSHKSRSVIWLPNPVNFIHNIAFIPKINKSSIFDYKDRVLSVNKGSSQTQDGCHEF